MCWFWHEDRLDARGRLPRTIDSIDKRYLALVILSNKECHAMNGDDYEFPKRSEMTDEDIEKWKAENDSIVPD